MKEKAKDEMMMEIIASLHPLERKVVPHLGSVRSLSDIEQASGLSSVEVMRAVQWLQNKGVLKMHEEAREMISLDSNGEKYLRVGLPEKRFLQAIDADEMHLDDIQSRAGLEKDELSVCLGALKSKAAIDIKKEKGLIVSITSQGRKLLKGGFLEESFLKKTFPLRADSLNPEEKFACDALKKRKGIIRATVRKERTIDPTSLGIILSKKGLSRGKVIDSLTPKHLKSGSWKKKTFRRYDVSINVPSISGGRLQHYRRFLDHVRSTFISLGFEEMSGPIVETDFWDMDALFMPQFHSARDIHDAYYIRDPPFGKLDENLVSRVKAAHENGGKTRSRGWRYKFDVDRTHRHLLRTQGTACSARKLASAGLKVPGKYFSIARCFRYDVIDATHNCDFYQTEGIVVEEGLNFGHLKGLLRMFAEKFADTGQIKIVPAYFPFTEPSAELHAKHPKLGWIELGGAGIFRKEVTNPLGVNVPVLAWGLGIDRIGMFRLKIDDIRDLFSHDLDKLQKSIMV